jgi:hypothetical protein
VQQPQPFRIEFGRHLGEPGGVAPGPGQRGDKTLLDGIVDLHEHDRDRPCGCLQGGRLLPADAGDDGRRHRHQLASQAAEPVGLAHRIPQLDLNGLASDVAKLFERPAKRLELRRFVARVGAHQDTDAGNSCWLLRNSGNRPGERCAAKGSKELAAFHSMTSSARARIDGGTVRPSAVAVFRLTVNLKCVGCSIGSSPGAAPRKMRTT